MSFTAKDVMTLRQRTGAGMMDCKNALTETNGDMEKAIDYLREKGIAKAAKKAGRIAAEGLVDSYIHMNGTIGVLVEVNCETDFVARGDQFKALVHDIARHIAAAKPEYLAPEDVPASVLEHEKEILRAQAIDEGKPAAIVDRMVEGRVKKYYEEACLLNQAFVKDPSMTIEKLVKSYSDKMAKTLSIKRFVRFEMGEGLEMKSNDFAAEVEAQMKK